MASSVLALVAGYAVAVPLCFRYPGIVRDRRRGELLALMVGTALIITGWWSVGNYRAALVNSVALLGFAGYFVARRSSTRTHRR